MAAIAEPGFAATAPEPDAPPCDLVQLPARLAAEMAARGAHPARTLVLLPYGQLIADARRAWAAHAPDGFSPRFETTLSWASRYGFSPDADDLSFDRGLDLLSAQSLLDAAGLGRRARVLAPRLVEAAWQLAPLAAAVPPSDRGHWVQAARHAGGWGLDHPVLALEAAITQLAIEWAGASAYVTDRLLGQDLAPTVDLLVVLEGLQPDPVARAIARGLGDRAQRWALRAQAPAGHVRGQACSDPADEADRAAACVMQHLTQGREPVALAAIDRLLTRRVRALLAARGVRIADETGWKLSTTRAAARFMALLRGARREALADDVIDWLKGVPAAPALALQALEQHLRRLGLRAWAPVEATLARSVERSGAGGLAMGPVGEPGGAGDLAGAWALVVQANTWRQQLQAPRSLARWQQTLRELLQATALWDPLVADAAGQQLTAALGLDEAGQALWAGRPQAGRRLTLDELDSWVGEALEAASYLPEAPAHPQVVVLPFSQMLGRRFAAAVVPGCDEQRLAASPEPPGPWTAAQRVALGLPTRDSLEQAQRAGWLAALTAPVVDLLWRRQDDSGEPVLPSPLVQQLALTGQIHEAPDPRAWRRIGAQPLVRPAPAAPALLAPEISASAYGDLRRCPYRYFALRQLGLQEAAELDVELEKRDFGNWLHEVLHDFHEALATMGQVAAQDTPAQRLQLEQLLDQAAEAVTARRGLEPADFLPFEAAWPQARQGYLAAWSDFEAEHQSRYVGGERDHSTSIGAVRLKGRIDRMDRLPDGTTVVMDYKTEGLDITQQRIKDPLEDTQLPFYAALVGGSPLRAFYVNVGERGETQFLEQPEVESARQALVQGLQQDMQRIRAGHPMPALGEGSACEHCAARGLCRKDFWAPEGEGVSA